MPSAEPRHIAMPRSRNSAPLVSAAATCTQRTAGKYSITGATGRARRIVPAATR